MDKGFQEQEGEDLTVELLSGSQPVACAAGAVRICDRFLASALWLLWGATAPPAPIGTWLE
ncbi:MAG: hypothetical protein HY644_02530 [Acidobacteria bacterium]|nr:hypothetical protein [Acidobacteriota bacterium]